MYFLSIIAVILASALMMCSGAMMASWTWYFDPVSLILLVLITIPIMISAGLLKDFNNAFRFAIKRNADATYTQLKRSIEAVILFRKTLIAAGAFTFLFALVFIFVYNNMQAESLSIEKLLVNIAVASLSLLYALAFVIILLPLESRLKVKLQEMMHE